MKKLLVILTALGILCAAGVSGLPAEKPEDGASYEVGVPSPEKIGRCISEIRHAAEALASDFSVKRIPADEPERGRTVIIRFGSEE